jgi:4-amino-4-deoxy-L-arabinose transferase-like glycosyltransferase
MTHLWNKDNILPLSLFFLTVFSRIPFTSRLLYHMDSAHFALAIDKYDIRVHQPHPPGYFLYVMLGRFINLFIRDANSTYIFISILFSGLAVVAVYYLGKEIFDKKIGIFAAAVALTSPNVWFHGEVALTYIVEAFFSTLIALLCWRILKGKHKYIWLSVFVLGVAGGIRQDTVVFLFPLWLFSVKGVPVRKVLASVGLLGLVCLLWFIPMIRMTGGWNAYYSAFRDLWLFNTGHVSVFEKGWASFKIFSSTLFRFIFYGIGAGIFVLGLATYSLLRSKRLKSLDREKVFFFSLWILPSFFFYLFVFIHPTNPGYVLIFLPALFVLTAVSIEVITMRLQNVLKRDVAVTIMIVIITINALIFILSKYPTSYSEIKTHDELLSVMLTNLRTVDPSNTVIFITPYTFYSLGHIEYYLPEYRVYQIDHRAASTGEVRKTFWGVNRETFLTDQIILPGGFSQFASPLISSNIKNLIDLNGLIIRNI